MNRIDKMKNSFRNTDLDALLITDINNIRYLTGFTGSNAICIITPKNQYVITDFRYKEQIANEVKSYKILIAKSSLYEEVFQKRLLDKAYKIGFESENISYANFSNLKKAFAGKKFIPLSYFVEKLAAEKDEDEIKNIKEAIKISEIAFRGLIEEGFKDQTEKDIAFELSSRMIIAGSEKNAFNPIVASGSNSSMPHAKPTGRKIRKGEPLLMDFGADYNGYNSDITRTIFCGKPGEEFKKVYQVVLDAQRFAIDGIKEGVSCKDIDALARNHIQKKGYGKLFGHALGHGIGAGAHCLPLISFRSKDVLIENMVITIEPGIYLPGKFGVRIEDDLLVKKNGFEILTKIERELIVL
jgi:Xaa-Pro aminopeptidase